MTRHRWLALCSIPLATDLPAQGNVNLRDTTMINRSSNPLLTNFRFRSIGPASMGGRIDDIEVLQAARSSSRARTPSAARRFSSTSGPASPATQR